MTQYELGSINQLEKDGDLLLNFLSVPVVHQISPLLQLYRPRRVFLEVLAARLDGDPSHERCQV